MGERRLEYLPIDELAPAAKNPKKHAIGLLADSLDQHGYTEPLLVDERTGRLVAGHGRLEALQAAQAAGGEPPDGVTVADGRWMVPVVRGWASTDDYAASRYLVASNALVERGGWDDRALADLLAELGGTDPGLVGTGYGADDLDDLLARLAAVEPPPLPVALTDPDEVPEPPAEPVTKRGDLWLLDNGRGGQHRLLAGDCRNADDVARLVNGQAVNVAFTSPPYADRRVYDDTTEFDPIPPDEYVEWFAPVAATVAEVLAPDGSWFVNIKAGAETLDTELYVLDLVAAHVRRWGWHFATELCWERLGMPKEPVLRFKNQFEPVYQFTRDRWKFRPTHVQHESDAAIRAQGPGSGNTNWADPTSGFTTHGEPGGEWFKGRVVHGFAYPGNRLPSFASTHEATGHTAAFPVGLPAFFIKAYSDPGDVIYDPFMGSGSTLLAAHQEGRLGLGCEISPGYVDIALARFQRLTGVKPVLESTGEAHDFTA